MYIYISIITFTYIHKCIHICICIDTYEHIHIYICMCMHIHSWIINAVPYQLLLILLYDSYIWLNLYVSVLTLSESRFLFDNKAADLSYVDILLHPNPRARTYILCPERHLTNIQITHNHNLKQKTLNKSLNLQTKQILCIEWKHC